jgi:hypothetical protein
MAKRLQLSRTTHILPFERLSPLDFERLCLWLVRREGFRNAEHLGAAGGEQGRDILALSPNGRRIAFQCKRVGRLDPSGAEKEIKKLRSLPAEDQPDDIVFVVSTAVTVTTRSRARAAWGDKGSCNFWAGSELDERVKRYADILHEFFDSGPGGWPWHRVVKPVLLPYPSLGDLFRGREAFLASLRESLQSSREAGAIAGLALHGLGGVGKTRLAVECRALPSRPYSSRETTKAHRRG